MSELGQLEQREPDPRGPLAGLVIAVTRMAEQSASLADPLRLAGARVIEAPTIELAQRKDWTAVDEALGRLSEYDWLVLTSANGVDALFGRLRALGMGEGLPAGPKVAVIGKATADRLAEHGRRPDLLPREAVGESMAEALIARGVMDRSVLLLRAELAREELPVALMDAGAQCDDLTVYATVPPRSLPVDFQECLYRGQLDWITLTSPSSFVNLLELVGQYRHDALRRVKLASIGPMTSRAIRQAGFEVACQADPHDVSGLVRAVCAAVGRGR